MHCVTSPLQLAVDNCPSSILISIVCPDLSDTLNHSHANNAITPLSYTLGYAQTSLVVVVLSEFNS